MRIIASFAALAALAVSMPANAQNYLPSSLTQSARDLYASCATLGRRSGLGDARASCACITGYMGGSLSDRDLEVAATLLRIGEMSESGASQEAIDAEVIAFLQKGYTQQDVERVSGMIQQLGARGDAICGQFEQKPSS